LIIVNNEIIDRKEEMATLAESQLCQHRQYLQKGQIQQHRSQRIICHLWQCRQHGQNWLQWHHLAGRTVDLNLKKKIDFKNFLNCENVQNLKTRGKIRDIKIGRVTLQITLNIVTLQIKA
jgi:hypothetical protein